MTSKTLIPIEKKIFSLFFAFFLFILNSCGQRSHEEFREEGEAITRSLVKELKNIYTREELLHSADSLGIQFTRLANVMMAAEEFCLKHPEQERCELGLSNRELSDQLRVELNRLYLIEGGRQIIEKTQENALYRLQVREKLRTTQLHQESS